MKATRTAVMVAGAAAVVAISASTGAVAGSMVTSAQIKNGTITSADIKDGSIGTGELQPRARSVFTELAGYEVVEKVFPNTSLPTDPFKFYDARCPVGKVALGGGSLVQLYNASGFVGLGRASISTLVTESEVSLHVDQPVERGATKATITVYATCAKGS